MDETELEEKPHLTLTVLEEPLAICRLDRDAPFPAWACEGTFCSVTRTSHELSIVCPEESVPEGLECEPDWRALCSEGPLGFTLTGVVEALAEPLAVAGISIFVISTFHTDYLMVKKNELPVAIQALRHAGHAVREAG